MGHSLGEYGALCAAGALGFADTLRLVRKRASLQQEAVPPGVGANAAIQGLGRETIEGLCREVSGDAGLVSPSCYNAPDQTVVSGHTAPVEAVMAKALAAGARRALMLPLSALSCALLRGRTAVRRRPRRDRLPGRRRPGHPELRSGSPPQRRLDEGLAHPADPPARSLDRDDRADGCDGNRHGNRGGSQAGAVGARPADQPDPAGLERGKPRFPRADRRHAFEIGASKGKDGLFKKAWMKGALPGRG